MKITAAAVFVFLTTLNLRAQQRVALDFNTESNNANGTISYQKVVKSNFILNAGIIFGQLGRSSVINDRKVINSDYTVVSPYQSVNQPFDMFGYSFNLLSYSIRSNGIALQLGAGYFHEFTIKHGVKFQFLGRLGYSDTRIIGKYYTTSYFEEIEKRFTEQHFIAGVSPELTYTFRLSGRFTFCTGFKFPYFFQFEQKEYKPINVKDKFYGLEPEFTMGLTYMFGECE